MLKTGMTQVRRDRKVKIIVAWLILALFVLLLGLNYRQLFAAWAASSETQRLEELAGSSLAEYQNPPPIEDRFEGKLSPDFWEFTAINGGGQLSHETAWHAAEMTFDSSLTIQHFSDPSFKDEPADWHKPAADQYNNISLIGASGFRPSISSDVVLKFTAWVDERFYGTAGVVFQPVGTLQKDGSLAERLNFFGFSIVGKESWVKGTNGPICDLALNWIPAQVEPLQVDTLSPHTYEVRLRWIDQTEWSGSVKVDGTTQCEMRMPAFGPVEVHVWSDNYLLPHNPRRWWEIAPVMELKYQDGGDKQFHLGMIQIFEEER